MPVRAPLQSAMDQWVGLEADPFAKDGPPPSRQDEGAVPRPEQVLDAKTPLSLTDGSVGAFQTAKQSQAILPDPKLHSEKHTSNDAPAPAPSDSSNSPPRTRRHGEVRGESLAQGSVRPREVMEALAQVNKSFDERQASEYVEPAPTPIPDDAMDVVEEEKEPTFYPLASHLQHPELLASLLKFLTFRDWCILTAVNDATRRSIEHKRELRETVLEHWLGNSAGYERWRWEMKEVVQLTFRVRAFCVRLFSPLSKLVACLRGYSRMSTRICEVCPSRRTNTLSPHSIGSKPDKRLNSHHNLPPMAATPVLNTPIAPRDATPLRMPRRFRSRFSRPRVVHIRASY